MVKPKKELQASAAIWRSAIEDEEDEDDPNEGSLFATLDVSGSTMHLHDNNKKKKNKSVEDFSLTNFDSKLSYTFRRNYQFLQNVFSIDTIVKPLPPAMADNVSRNLSFFRRVFTQFFEPEGISNAQKSLRLGQEEKFRKVR